MKAGFLNVKRARTSSKQSGADVTGGSTSGSKEGAAQSLFEATMPIQDSCQAKQVVCVKMACSGDWTNPPGMFTSITLPADSPIFRDGELSAISCLVGQPMALYRLPPGPALASERQKLDNVFATFMMLEADPSQPGFGWAPPKYQSHIGSVIVARRDFSPLTVLELELMADFCQCYMQTKLESYLESDSTDPSEVMAALTPDNYKEQTEDHLRMLQMNGWR